MDRRPFRLLALLAALSLPASSRASETQACGKAGYPHNDGTVPEAANADKYCTDLGSCSRFCCAACKFDPENWNANATCDNLPASNSTKIVSEDGTQALSGKPGVAVASGARGTAAAQEGIDHLSALIPAMRARYPQYGEFTVKVKSCWRTVRDDAEKVCGWVIRKLHVDQSPKSTDAQKQSWAANANNVWGLVWPGATPHSGGFACDMVLVDARGQECFGWMIGDSNTDPTCSIDQHAASSLMDELATDASVGAVRLTFEAWHYEWGSPYTSCRCTSRQDCARYWPPKGDKNCQPR